MRESIGAEHSISFNIDNYKGEEDLFNDVARLMRVLIKNDYQCSFRYEDVGIYVLDYGYGNPDFGAPMIYWLEPDQVDCLYTSNYIGQDEEESTE